MNRECGEGARRPQWPVHARLNCASSWCWRCGVARDESCRAVADPARVGLRRYAIEMASMLLTIVVPAYNEAERLGRTLPQILAWVSTFHDGGRVVVVDDGSTDATGDAVRV